MPDESVVVNADGTLRNAVVYVKDGPNVATDATNVLLTQRGCRYVPHVLAVRTGQTIAVTSHDDTLHNVHVESATNPGQNFSEQLGGSHAVTFDRPDPDVLFKCDVHAWMSAHVTVFDHPFFAVTGDDGAFDLGELPPGTYTIVVWQETFGTTEQPFTVTADKPDATVNFHIHR